MKRKAKGWTQRTRPPYDRSGRREAGGGDGYDGPEGLAAVGEAGGRTG